MKRVKSRESEVESRESGIRFGEPCRCATVSPKRAPAKWSSASPQRLLPLAFCFLASLGLLLVLSCNDKAPGLWPWWTDADRAAVTQELTVWRDSISTRGFMEWSAQSLLDSADIISRDSSSPTGDSLIKVRRITAFGLLAADTARRDSMMFGVTVDSIFSDTSWRDTFCQVLCFDSTLNGFAEIDYDQYWVIYYRRKVTGTPPDTSVEWVLDDSAPSPRLVTGAVGSAQKDAPWNVLRYVFLRKDTMSSAYHLRRMSGFGLFLPSTSDAPSILSIALTYQGRPDTFRLGARLDHHGIYNLRDKDSLYSVSVGQPLLVYVNIDKTKLKKGDALYYFAWVDGQRVLLARDSLPITSSITFAEPGLKHLTLEVVPQSNLLYPGSAYSAAIWSMPIRVKE